MEIQAWRHASTNSLSPLTPQWCKGGKRVHHSHHQVLQQTHPAYCDSESDTYVWTLMAKWQWSDRLPVV